MLLFYLRNRRNVAQESILRFSYLLAFILLTQNNFYFKSEDIYGNLNMYFKQTSTKEFAYAPPPQALPIKRIKSPKKTRIIYSITLLRRVEYNLTSKVQNPTHCSL